MFFKDPLDDFDNSEPKLASELNKLLKKVAAKRDPFDSLKDRRTRSKPPVHKSIIREGAGSFRIDWSTVPNREFAGLKLKKGESLQGAFHNGISYGPWIHRAKDGEYYKLTKTDVTNALAHRGPGYVPMPTGRGRMEAATQSLATRILSIYLPQVIRWLSKGQRVKDVAPVALSLQKSTWIAVTAWFRLRWFLIRNWVKRRLQGKPPFDLRIRRVNVDKWLTPKALKAQAKQVNSTLLSGRVLRSDHSVINSDDAEDACLMTVPCHYFAKTIELPWWRPTWLLPRSYKTRCANFLNDLAERMGWQAVLSPLSVIDMRISEVWGGTLLKPTIKKLWPARRTVSIFAFVFLGFDVVNEDAKEWFDPENENYYKPLGGGTRRRKDGDSFGYFHNRLGAKVFINEGEVGSGDWSKEAFPW